MVKIIHTIIEISRGRLVAYSLACYRSAYVTAIARLRRIAPAVTPRPLGLPELRSRRREGSGQIRADQGNASRDF